jgi:dTDP-4-amino-4,6-dideoxygalactose transaminase
VRAYANQGQAAKYDHVIPGFNYRLSDLSAAVAWGQMLDALPVIETRRENAARLLSGLVRGTLPNPLNHVWHQFVIGVPNRDSVIEWLRANGVESGVHYPVALPDLGWIKDAYAPKARLMAETVLSIPVHEHLTSEDIDLIIEAVNG